MDHGNDRTKINSSPQNHLTVESSLENDDSVSPLSPAISQPEPSNEEILGSKETLDDVGVLVCVFFSNLIYAIDLTGNGVFYPYLIEYFEESTAAVTWFSSIHGFSQAIVSLFSSYPIEWHGCRLPSVIGSLLFAVGMALSSMAPNLTAIYVTYGIVAGGGTGLYLLSSNVIVHQRFHRNRNLASGIGWIGLTCGGVLGSIVTHTTIQFYGWRGAFLLLGAVQAQRIPLCLFFRTPSKFIKKSTNNSPGTGNKMSISCRAVYRYIKATLDFRLLRRVRFSLYVVANGLQTYSLYSYIPHTVNRALRIGLTNGQALTAASTINVMCLMFRIIVSFVSNIPKVNPSLLYAVGLYLAALSVVCLFVLPEIAATFTSVVLFGIHQGCTTTISSVVIVSLMGVKILPRCQAILLFFAGVAKLISPSSIGLIYDVTGSYNGAFGVIGCASFVGGSIMILLVIVTRRKPKPTFTE